MNFHDFLEKFDYGEIYEDETGAYVKLLSPDEEGIDRIEVWKLSPNGLTGDGYSPYHGEYYDGLINPGFDDDSEKAKLIEVV